MTTAKYSAPQPKAAIASPDLWRPTQYDDDLRDAGTLWLGRGECIDPELNGLVVKLLADIPRHALFAYPTPGPLYRKLARHLNVPAEHLMLTRGSDGAIKAVFEAYIGPGDRVVLTKPTYQMYGVYSQMFGADVTGVPYQLKDGRPHLEASELIKTIAAVRPKLVGLPNPDNPTGFAFSPGDLRAIVEAAGDVGALMMVDEAYYPFLDETAIDWVGEYGHLVVARTFSKAWGMAGIRLGFTVAQPEITAMLNKVRTMVEADGVSMELAMRMLDHQDDVNASLARLKEGRAFFAAEMNALGFAAIETPCNFVHVDFADKRPAIEAALKGVASYRVFPVPPLENFLRFTTTTIEQFRRVVEVIRNATL